jgi:plasmid stabilization system protein ParE
MSVKFLKVAQQELDDAFNWYEDQLQGLGFAFLDEIDKCVRRISAYPLSCSEIGEGLRRCVISRFPYGLIYGIEGDDVIVLAVAPLHREPRYWAERK